MNYKTKKYKGARFYKNGDILDVNFKGFMKALKVIQAAGLAVAIMPGMEYNREVDMINMFWLEPEAKKGNVILQARWLGGIPIKSIK